MPKVPTPLSETKIKKLKPKNKIYRVSDGNNLYIEIKPNGAKFWRFRYKLNGKYSMVSLGEYPFISLKRARVLALEAKVAVLNGKHPKRDDKTIFSEIVEEFLKFKKSNLNEKFFKAQSNKIKHYIYPTLEYKPIKKITKEDIITLLKDVSKISLPNATKTKDKSETTKRVFILLNEIFKFALHNGYIQKSITQSIDISQIVPKSNVEHFRVELDTHRLREIYQKILSLNGTMKYPILFLILTALRGKNIKELKWEYIDLEKEIIVFPAEVMKTKESFRVPLTPTLKSILTKLEKKGEFVFINSQSKKLGENSLNYILKHKLNLNITSHSFRSSFSTIAYERQKEHHFSSEVIETQLSHRIGNRVTRAYLRSDFLEERRELLIWWETFLNPKSQ